MAREQGKGERGADVLREVNRKRTLRTRGRATGGRGVRTFVCTRLTLQHAVPLHAVLSVACSQRKDLEQPEGGGGWDGRMPNT